MCPSLGYLLGNHIVHRSGTKYHISTTEEAATVRWKNSTNEKTNNHLCLTILITKLKILLVWKISFSENRSKLLTYLYFVLQRQVWTTLKFEKDRYSRLGSPFTCILLIVGIIIRRGQSLVFIIVYKIKIYCSSEYFYNLLKCSRIASSLIALGS